MAPLSNRFSANFSIEPSSEAVIEALESNGTRIDVPFEDGVTVWRQWGAGEPLVLIHGGGGSWLHWIRNIEALSRHYRVLVPDLPGFGDSDVPSEQTATLRPGETNDIIPVAGAPIRSAPVDVLARILADALQKLTGTQPIRVAGFSFGGAVASHLCARFGPLRIQHLVLCGSVGIGTQAFGQSLPLVSWRGATDRQAFRDIHRQNLSMLMIADPDNIDDLAIDVQSLSTGKTRLRRARRKALGMTLLADAGINVDAIWGTRDPLLILAPEALQEALRHVDRNAEVHLIEAAGHWVGYEAPARFNATLLQLLAR